MITIHIQNTKDLVRKNGGVAVSKLGAFVDFEALVEAEIVEKLKANLEAEGVQAEIQSIKLPGHEFVLLPVYRLDARLLAAGGVKVRSSTTTGPAASPVEPSAGNSPTREADDQTGG